MDKDLRLLFFSGGSALRDFARALPALTGKSVHIITTFDSGGSAGVLRQYFDIPALGDLRSRLGALAEAAGPERQKTLGLWEKRLSSTQSFAALADALRELAQGRAAVYKTVTPEFRQALPELLGAFCERMPAYFDLRGACLGNLALAGAYFQCGGLQKAVDFCAAMLGSRGAVCPVSEGGAHLAASLASGRVIAGQHNFSAKVFSSQSSRLFAEEGSIRDIWLVKSPADTTEISIALAPAAKSLILAAELICYPPGSFYSSLLANLLPAGVGRSVAANPAPKVFVPNPGVDPELLGCTLRDQVEALLRVMLRDAPLAAPDDVLDYVLVDAQNGMYPGGLPADWLAGQGIRLVDCRLVDAGFQAKARAISVQSGNLPGAAEKQRTGTPAPIRDYDCPVSGPRRPWLHIAPELVFEQLAALAREHKK
jgi:CofD-related protein of GAK system